MLILIAAHELWAVSLADFRAIFPSTTRRTHTSNRQIKYYNLALGDAHIIIPGYENSKDIPIIFIQSKTNKDAVKTANRLADLLYGPLGSVYVFPFQGDEPSAAILSPDIFSAEKKYDWAAYTVTNPLPRNHLRTLLYPIWASNCTSVEEAKKMIQFIGWSKGSVKVRHTPVKNNTAAPSLPYELMIDITRPELYTVAYTPSKRLGSDKKLVEQMVELMLTATLTFPRMTNEMKKQHTRREYHCNIVLAMDDYHEMVVVRKDSAYIIGFQDDVRGLHNAPNFKFITPNTGAKWPTPAGANSTYKSGEMGRFLALHPQAKKHEGYYSLALDGCSVIICAPVVLNEQDNLIPAFFVTGTSGEHAKKVATRLISELYYRAYEPYFTKFAQDPNSVAVIHNAHHNKKDWEDWKTSGNLACAIVNNATAEPDSSQARRITSDETALQPNTPTDLFNILKWDGLHLHTLTAQGHTLIVDYSRPKLDYITIRPPASTPPDSIINQIGKTMNIQPSTLNALMAATTSKMKNAVQSRLNCDEVYMYYSCDRDFVIARKNGAYYAGSLQAIQYGLSEERPPQAPNAPTVEQPPRPLTCQDLQKIYPSYRSATVSTFRKGNADITAICAQDQVALLLITSDTSQEDAVRAAKDIAAELPEETMRGHLIKPFAGTGAGAAIYLPHITALRPDTPNTLTFLLRDGKLASYKDELTIRSWESGILTAQITRTTDNGSWNQVEAKICPAKPDTSCVEIRYITGDLKEFIFSEPARTWGKPITLKSPKDLPKDCYESTFITISDGRQKQYLISMKNVYRLGTVEALQAAKNGLGPAAQPPADAPLLDKYLEIIRSF